MNSIKVEKKSDQEQKRLVYILACRGNSLTAGLKGSCWATKKYVALAKGLTEIKEKAGKAEKKEACFLNQVCRIKNKLTADKKTTYLKKNTSNIYKNIPCGNSSQVTSSFLNKRFWKIDEPINEKNILYQDPKKYIKKKLQQDGFVKIKWKNIKGKIKQTYYIKAITKWIKLTHEEILKCYDKKLKSYQRELYIKNKEDSSETRAIKKDKLNYILKQSCAKTLSRKYRLKSRKKVFKKFGKYLTKEHLR